MPLVLEAKVRPGVKLAVWKLDESLQLLREMTYLNPEAESYFQTFKNERRKKQWLGYRLLMQHLMGKDSLLIAYNENGKPILTESNMQFSVSHSGEYSAAIIDENHPVGIDIEKIRDKIEKIQDRFLSEPELANIKGNCRLEMLHVCWGAKESLYKSFGHPEVDFKADIYLAHFDYLCNQIGNFPAQVRLGANLFDFMVHYYKLDDYMLVWTIIEDK